MKNLREANLRKKYSTFVGFSDSRRTSAASLRYRETRTFMKKNTEIQGYAVVTGASRGLGKSFALELASRHIDTILISLPGEGISQVCGMCREKGTDSICFEADLTDQKQLLAVTGEINSKYKVSILINNAGTGGSRIFEQAPVDYINTIIRLNAGVTTLMTHELLPNLKRNTSSYILNISSLASLTPTGYKTVYPASKIFVRYLSIGLRNELKGTGVSVSTALLGPMPTKPEIVERIKSQGKIGKFLTISTEKAAKECIDKMLKRKATIVSGMSNKFSYALLKLIPEGIRASVMTRTMLNELKCQGIETER